MRLHLVETFRAPSALAAALHSRVMYRGGCQTLQFRDPTGPEGLGHKGEFCLVFPERDGVPLAELGARRVVQGRPVRGRLGAQLHQAVRLQGGQFVAQVKRVRAMLVEDEVEAGRDSQQGLQEVGRLLQMRLPAPAPCLRSRSARAVSRAARFSRVMGLRFRFDQPGTVNLQPLLRLLQLLGHDEHEVHGHDGQVLQGIGEFQ